jgi:hypothetical protein
MPSLIGLSVSQSPRVKRQVDETVGVMRSNVLKTLSRGERLQDLEEKSGMFVYHYARTHPA